VQDRLLELSILATENPIKGLLFVTHKGLEGQEILRVGEADSKGPHSFITEISSDIFSFEEDLDHLTGLEKRPSLFEGQEEDNKAIS